tara:strand:- start:1733 stop:2299 length:567 start_codon:yes stop_codon:yes gene_type:complete
MLKWVASQKVSSDKGWSVEGKDRQHMKYTDEHGNNFIFEVDRGIDLGVYFDSLEPENSNLKLSGLQKDLIKSRIRKALDFMEIVYEECTINQNQVTLNNVIRRRFLVLEEISQFSSQEEFKSFEEFIDKQIKKGFLEEMAIDFNYNFKNRTGGRWFREELTNQYWRLIEPSNSFKGCWELVRKELRKR